MRFQLAFRVIRVAFGVGVRVEVEVGVVVTDGDNIRVAKFRLVLYPADTV